MRYHVAIALVFHLADGSSQQNIPLKSNGGTSDDGYAKAKACISKDISPKRP